MNPAKVGQDWDVIDMPYLANSKPEWTSVKVGIHSALGHLEEAFRAFEHFDMVEFRRVHEIEFMGISIKKAIDDLNFILGKK